MPGEVHTVSGDASAVADLLNLWQEIDAQAKPSHRSHGGVAMLRSLFTQFAQMRRELDVNVATKQDLQALRSELRRSASPLPHVTDAVRAKRTEALLAEVCRLPPDNEIDFSCQLVSLLDSISVILVAVVKMLDDRQAMTAADKTDLARELRVMKIAKRRFETVAADKFGKWSTPRAAADNP